jgi:hypothetical protein
MRGQAGPVMIDIPWLDLTTIALFLAVGIYTAKLIHAIILELIDLGKLLKRISVTITWRNEP